jgi:broad specificity phosphatase PhoE
VSDLLILRHGPTDWNASKRIQGRTDIPLSAEGRAEVQTWSIPSRFKDFHCLSSPLARTRETAEILGLEPEFDARLLEMAWGQWEGRTLADLREELGPQMAKNEALGMDFSPPGGESPRDTQERLRPLLRALTRPTVAVAHKGVIRALYALATGWDMRDKPETKIKPATAHLFHIDKQGQPVVDCMNIKLVEAPDPCV